MRFIVLGSLSLHLLFLLLATPGVLAQEPAPLYALGAPQITELDTTAQAESKEAESPWLAVPLMTINPKLGFSLGALGGYLHYFDSLSKVSTFGVSGMYTSTHSVIGMAFGKASFGEDHHRIVALIVGGNIKNDYDDFLGTGTPLKSNDKLGSAVTRYLYRFAGDWFGGGQFLYTNYAVIGQGTSDDLLLDALGVTGFKSGGFGVSAYHDSRDNENSPYHGWLLNANNIAYRDWLGGEENFDVYRADFRGFLSHGKGHVLAMRQLNQWTVDAPGAAYAPVQLRGYKRGQYLGKYMSSIEGEERLRLGDRWTATAFTGVAFLYGGGLEGTGSENMYPNWGGGIQFVLKEVERIVLNLEYAGGKKGNQGIYMIMGYAY